MMSSTSLAGWSLAGWSLAGWSLAGVSLAAAIDAVIALTVVEGLALVAWHRATGRGVAPRDFVVNLVSGLFLMLALRCAVRGIGSHVGTRADAALVVLALLAAGIAHATDLLLRARRHHHAAAPCGSTDHHLGRDPRGSKRSLPT